MEKIRVLVVDDSALVRQMLTRVLSDAARIEVVGTARDGVDAVASVAQLRPDVVTLDINMPQMDGLEALRRIVRDSDARVIILSSQDDQETSFRALEAGAVDFIAKPSSLASSVDTFGADLAHAIRTAYAVDPHKRFTHKALLAEPPTIGAVEHGDPERLVVIAASTGGPVALERVFAGLEADPRVAYLVVQHLPAGFSSALAERLEHVAGFPVVEAGPGMRIEGAHAYVAPYGMHMRVVGAPTVGAHIEFREGPRLHGLIPAADPLFESAAATFGSAVVGVVLTGMGSDGARGLCAIREAGGRTIAQDEASSVVWGMPGSAVRAGAAQVVVPIDEVAAGIALALRSRREVRR